MQLDHVGCKAAAEAVAKVLTNSKVKIDLTRSNTDLQDAAECGFRVIFWAEELVRRRRCEGQWTFPYDVAQQAATVNKIVKKLRDEKKKANS